MYWQKVAIHNLCEITSSKRIYVSDYQTEGIPFYRGREISEKFNGNIDVTTELFISENKYLEIKEKFGIPQTGDLLLTSVGTLGNPYVVKEGEVFYFKDGNLTWFRDFKGLESKYLYYWIVSPQGKAELKKCTIGSSQSAFTIVLLKDMQIALPPFPTQRRIADILSAYDDLIENNTRRLRILEQMAQAIYQEWFGKVDKESMPDGWNLKRFTDVCNELIDGDWIESKDQGGEDYRLLQVSNVGLGDFVETGNFRYITQETFDRLNCNEIIVDDILISRMPKPIGRGWLVTKMPWRMITAVDVAIARPNPDLLNRYYCIHWLNSPETLAKSEQHASGTTRPRITRRDLAGFEMVVPPIELQNKFGEIAKQLYEFQTNLRRKNDNLRQTRDLLLPRLVSGEIDVSSLS